jgi:hypothetical protein
MYYNYKNQFFIFLEIGKIALPLVVKTLDYTFLSKFEFVITSGHTIFYYI